MKTTIKPKPDWKIILISFVVGILILICGALALAQDTEKVVVDGKGNGAFHPIYCSSVVFSGGVSGEWLTVYRHNAKDPEARNFDPSYVSIISDFKPVVTRQKDGKFVIEFETEVPK